MLSCGKCVWIMEAYQLDRCQLHALFLCMEIEIGMEIEIIYESNMEIGMAIISDMEIEIEWKFDVKNGNRMEIGINFDMEIKNN